MHGRIARGRMTAVRAHHALAVALGVGLLWSITAAAPGGAPGGPGGELALMVAVTGALVGAAAVAPLLVSAARRLGALVRHRPPVTPEDAGRIPAFVTELRMTRPDSAGHPQPRAPGDLLPVA